MSTAYYNEFDKFAAEWLRELIKAGLIAPGIVDDRSIEDVTPNDLRGFTQHHFFAGIGVWSYALRSAGWPDDRQVWTASCPCQPFSAAGKGAGFTDERHLWPALHHLVQECRPSVIVGEQVASKDAGPWIDLIHSDLEALGYAFGCVPFPSSGVGAPHIRDRLYWVADASSARGAAGVSAPTRGHQGVAGIAHNSGGQCTGVQQRSTDCGLAATGRMADTDTRGRQPQSDTECASVQSEIDGESTAGEQSGDARSSVDAAPASGPTNGHWADADWLFCRDGKWRPVEPSTFPLAHGAPARVGRLRGYGNAVNAQAAQVFIESLVT